LFVCLFVCFLLTADGWKNTVMKLAITKAKMGCTAPAMPEEMHPPTK